MNVLLDAHLPRRLVSVFHAAGHDAIHTLDLPDSNATSDAEIPAVIAVGCGTTWTWVTRSSVGQKAFGSLSAITTPRARCQQVRNFRT
jgi:Ethanolamine utilization protein EutJ (predicted chaperonin)